jgi:hypothetical protein
VQTFAGFYFTRGGQARELKASWDGSEEEGKGAYEIRVWPKAKNYLS